MYPVHILSGNSKYNLWSKFNKPFVLKYLLLHKNSRFSQSKSEKVLTWYLLCMCKYFYLLEIYIMKGESLNYWTVN